MERFRNEYFSLEDKQRSGRPIEIDSSELMRVTESDSTLKTLPSWLELPWVLHDLSPDQKYKTCRRQKSPIAEKFNQWK